MVFFHCALSSHCFLHRLTPIICKSSVPAIHLFRGLPRVLVPIGFHCNILLGVLLSSIRITWPSQAILLLFINLTISAFPVSSFSSANDYYIELKKKEGRNLPNIYFIHRIYLYKPIHIWLWPSIWGLTSQFERFTFLSTDRDGWTILKRVQLSFADKYRVWSRCTPFICCKTLILTYKITTLSPISILEQQ